MLEIRGLQLNAIKSRVVCTIDGFDFLGFNIRHVPKLGWKRLAFVPGDYNSGIDKKLRPYY